MKYKIVAIFLLLQFIKPGQVRCDYYTSISGLEYLLASEVHLLENYENYVKKVELNNERILSFLDELENIYKVIKEDPVAYFGDPFNAFKVLKRFTYDWKRLEEFIYLNQEAIDYAENVSKMPELGYANATKEDLIGASKGLARLQSTYALKASDIAEGILMDYDYNSTLSAHDCFELGRNLYDAHQNYYASEWLLEARMLFNEELAEQDEEAEEKILIDFPFLSDIEILEYLAPSMFNIGNKKIAHILNEELLAQNPTNNYGLANKKLFEAGILEDRRIKLVIDEEPQPIHKKTSVEALYEAVCRGDEQQTPREKRNLRCRYVTNKVPFCLLAPFKMEELNHDPFVAFFHDAIYDDEIENIINVTENKVERSKVGDLGRSSFSEVRTSKNTWLSYENHKFLDSIHQRLRDITGLNLDNAEPLQIANYGIGGHYGPHYDFSEDPDVAYPGKGNRILTALFYINDVDLGGGTAFPFLKLAVPPIKGGLVIWYNMHESLELDYRTRHAGCPVLKGSKWICNEWFHQVGQEFTRPCSLERNGEISIGYRDLV